MQRREVVRPLHVQATLAQMWSRPISIRSRNKEATHNGPTHLKAFPHPLYLIRSLGIGLGILPIAMVLAKLGASWQAWSWAIFVASRGLMLATSCHPETGNRSMLLTVVSAGQINTGVRGLWLRSLSSLAFGTVGMAH